MGKTITKVLRPGVMRLLYFMGAHKVQPWDLLYLFFKKNMLLYGIKYVQICNVCRRHHLFYSMENMINIKDNDKRRNGLISKMWDLVLLWPTGK